MNLNHLMVFAKVVENQSFTKAGKVLGMEKSNVSYVISQLETRLGARLLNRTTRSVSLTEAGRGYYQYCAEIVAKAEEADHYAQSLTDEPQGTLKITAPQEFNIILESLIKPYLDRYPKVNVSISLTDRRVDILKEGFDLAFRGGYSRFQDSSLIAKLVFSSQMGLFASPAFLEKNGTPTKISDLKNMDTVSVASDGDFNRPGRIVVIDSDREREIITKGRVKVDSLSAAIQSSILDLGIIEVPAYLLEKELKRGSLKQILKHIKLPEARLYALYPSREGLPAKSRQFLAFLDDWQKTLTAT
ncbi:MAG: LysR family transcriptional regulator [SAR324 cluster bacterium]|nr:LysR family transcriptional regulator [SAR324 cluster bacterium]